MRIAPNESEAGGDARTDHRSPISVDAQHVASYCKRGGGIDDILLAMLEGSRFATALRGSGRPGRIALPKYLDALRALVAAHVQGKPANLTFCAAGREAWSERIDAVVLSAYCPRDDGSVGWIGIDLDGADHGATGLADPTHAARVIAERAYHIGIGDGLLVARSRGGVGRHAFVLFDIPVPLEDAVLGTAALAASAFRIAESDRDDCGTDYAFQRADGRSANPGDSGAVELFPRSSARPAFGWALALPGAGAFADRGGGVIVDPFTDNPIPYPTIPRCDVNAWSVLVREAKSAIRRGRLAWPTSVSHVRGAVTAVDASIFNMIDMRTRDFLEGRAEEGARNNAAFAASANLLGCGVPKDQAERMILRGAAVCGLPVHEARAALRSAAKSLARKRGVR